MRQRHVSSLESNLFSSFFALSRQLLRLLVIRVNTIVSSRNPKKEQNKKKACLKLKDGSKVKLVQELGGCRNSVQDIPN
jgi:hypothetical protein